MLLSRWLPRISSVMRYFSLYSHTVSLSSSRLHIQREVCWGGGWSGALNMLQFGHAGRSTFIHFEHHIVQYNAVASRFRFHGFAEWSWDAKPQISQNWTFLYVATLLGSKTTVLVAAEHGWKYPHAWIELRLELISWGSRPKQNGDQPGAVTCCRNTVL